MVRDLLAREVIAPAWRDLLVVFRRMDVNLAGIILPGPRVNAQGTTVVTLG